MFILYQIYNTEELNEKSINQKQTKNLIQIFKNVVEIKKLNAACLKH